MILKWILIGYIWFGPNADVNNTPEIRERTMQTQAECIAYAHNFVNTLTEKDPTIKVATICASDEDMKDGEPDNEDPKNYYDNFNPK